MKILSIECSASPASCAVTDNGKVIASSFINTKLTHSQTLMRMIINMFENSAVKLSDIDAIAVAAGPGSFTGLRIGISAVKGLAEPGNLPCYPVSTLSGMAENLSNTDCVMCAVMDARCNQFYNALFKINGGVVTRLCPDRALLAGELYEELKKFSNGKIIICGDGADLFYKQLENTENIILASESLKFQSAVGVGLYVHKNIDVLTAVEPENLLPVYLRLPQAERELKQKQKTNNSEVIK